MTMNRSLSFESRKFNLVVALFRDEKVQEAKTLVSEVYRQGVQLQRTGVARIKELEMKQSVCLKDIERNTKQQQEMQRDANALQHSLASLQAGITGTKEMLRTLSENISDCDSKLGIVDERLKCAKVLRAAGYAASVLTGGVLGMAVHFVIDEGLGLGPKKIVNDLGQEKARLENAKEQMETSMKNQQRRLTEDKRSLSMLDERLCQCNEDLSNSHKSVSCLKKDIYATQMALSACREFEIKMNSAVEKTAGILDICDAARSDGNTGLLSARGTMVALYAWGTAWEDIRQTAQSNAGFLTHSIWKCCQSLLGLEPPSGRPGANETLHGQESQIDISIRHNQDNVDQWLRERDTTFVFIFVLATLLIVVNRLLSLIHVIYFLLTLPVYLVYGLAYYLLYCPFYYLIWCPVYFTVWSAVCIVLQLCPLALVVCLLAYLTQSDNINNG